MSGLIVRYKLTCISLAIRRRFIRLVSLFRRFLSGKSRPASVRSLVFHKNLSAFLSDLNFSGERYLTLLTRIYTPGAVETTNPLKK